jgi:hypothetical protein
MQGFFSSPLSSVLSEPYSLTKRLVKCGLVAPLINEGKATEKTFLLFEYTVHIWAY